MSNNKRMKKIQPIKIAIVLLVTIAIFTSLMLIAIHNGWGDFGSALLSVTLAIVGGGGVLIHVLRSGTTHGYKEPADISEHCLEFSRVKSLVAQEAHGNLEIDLAENKQCFTATISNVDKEKCLRHGFFMALIDFLPYKDWSDYSKNDFALEFEICGTGLNAIQLEVKNATSAKIIDRKISNLTEKQIVKCELGGQEDAWKEVKEICFVVFTNDEYMQNINADRQFTVENLYLKRC